MKNRYGFVSNSSSPSFIIDLNKINKEKKRNKIIKKVMNCNYYEYDKYIHDDSKWSVYHDEDTNKIDGSTWMDNFDFIEYIEDVYKVVFDRNWEKVFKESVKVDYRG